MLRSTTNKKRDDLPRDGIIGSLKPLPNVPYCETCYWNNPTSVCCCFRESEGSPKSRRVTEYSSIAWAVNNGSRDLLTVQSTSSGSGVAYLVALWEKTKRTRLEFSGWHLRPYIHTGTIMYVHVCIGSTDESQHRLSMWQHVLGACIKHSHEMEERTWCNRTAVAEWKRSIETCIRGVHQALP